MGTPKQYKIGWVKNFLNTTLSNFWFCVYHGMYYNWKSRMCPIIVLTVLWFLKCACVANSETVIHMLLKNYVNEKYILLKIKVFNILSLARIWSLGGKLSHGVIIQCVVYNFLNQPVRFLARNTHFPKIQCKVLFSSKLGSRPLSVFFANSYSFEFDHPHIH